MRPGSGRLVVRRNGFGSVQNNAAPRPCDGYGGARRRLRARFERRRRHGVEAGDASPGSWAGPDATGGNNDSPSPLETDATMETGSVAIDASDVVDEGLVLAAGHLARRGLAGRVLRRRLLQRRLHLGDRLPRLPPRDVALRGDRHVRGQLRELRNGDDRVLRVRPIARQSHRHVRGPKRRVLPDRLVFLPLRMQRGRGLPGRDAGIGPLFPPRGRPLRSGATPAARMTRWPSAPARAGACAFRRLVYAAERTGGRTPLARTVRHA